MAISSTAEWLEVVHVDKAQWRLSDSRRDSGSDGRLLGFVERVAGDRYEILWMTEPPRWAYVDSLELAIAAFGDDRDFAESSVSERETARPRRRGWRRWVH